MGLDTNQARFCDCCGRLENKIHCVYQGRDFCTTCYAREFKHLPCVVCETATRTHKSNERPLCAACDRQTRTCIRCNKPVPGRAGRRIGGGITCAACTPYFRERMPCSVCAKPSLHLSRDRPRGFMEPTCSVCRNAGKGETCSRCKGLRTMVFTTLEKKGLCRDCLPGEERSHNCPGCGELQPGGGNSECVACGIGRRARLHRDLHATLLAQIWVRELFVEYSDWLIARQPKNANVQDWLKNHMVLFTRVDVTFTDAAEMTGEAMLSSFGASFLKDYRLPRWFLTEKHGLDFEGAWDKNAEQERIVHQIAAHNKASHGPVLQAFEQDLRSRGLAPLTQRLYVRAAVAFCERAKISTSMPPSQTDLDKLMRASPGLRNSLTQFLRFGRETYGWALDNPSPKIKSKLPTTMTRLDAVNERITRAGLAQASVEDLVRSIFIPLGIPIKQRTKCQWVDAKQGLAIQLKEEVIVIPDSIKSRAIELRQRAPAGVFA